MRTLKIQVTDKDYKRVKAFLSTLKTAALVASSHVKKTSSSKLVSEKSLAEDWLSAEDSRYEHYFQKNFRSNPFFKTVIARFTNLIR